MTMLNLSDSVPVSNAAAASRRQSGKKIVSHAVSAILTAVFLTIAVMILPGTVPILENNFSEGTVLTAEAKTMRYYATAEVNIRAKASSKSERLGSFSAGDPVDVVSISKGWAKISYNDSTAYVSAKYLATEYGARSSSKSAKVSTSVSSGGGTVWISATGSKYHSRNNCGRMNPAKAHQETKSQAIAEGYEPCSKCW